jgi:hypothetical protein
MGIFLGYSASSPLHGYRVAPWVKNALTLHRKDDHTVQPVEMQGPIRLKRRKGLQRKITVDKQYNIFQMHRKAEDGMVYDGIGVYARIF